MAIPTHAAVIHLLDSARGIYIPQNFIETCDPLTWGLSQSDIDALSNPGNESYWDTWHNVLNNATRILDAQRYRLHHDGDLWALNYDNMTEEERRDLGFYE